MMITTKGYASFRKYTEDLPAEGSLELPEGTPVSGLMKRLGIPIGIKKIILVNGRHRSEDHVLLSGDTVVFFPPLEGG